MDSLNLIPVFQEFCSSHSPPGAVRNVNGWLAQRRRRAELATCFVQTCHFVERASDGWTGQKRHSGCTAAPKASDLPDHYPLVTHPLGSAVFAAAP